MTKGIVKIFIVNKLLEGYYRSLLTKAKMRSSESGFSCLYRSRRSRSSSRYSSSTWASSSCCLKEGPQGSSGRSSRRAKS